MFFLTAAAFGVPLQAAVDLLPPGNPALNLIGVLVACAAALGCYARHPARRRTRGIRARAPAGAVRARRRGRPGSADDGGLDGRHGRHQPLRHHAVWRRTGPDRTGPGPCRPQSPRSSGCALRLLWRAFGPLPAFAIAALVFGALHLANPGATVLAGATVAVAGLRARPPVDTETRFLDDGRRQHSPRLTARPLYAATVLRTCQVGASSFTAWRFVGESNNWTFSASPTDLIGSTIPDRTARVHDAQLCSRPDEAA